MDSYEQVTCDCLLASSQWFTQRFGSASAETLWRHEARDLGCPRLQGAFPEEQQLWHWEVTSSWHLGRVARPIFLPTHPLSQTLGLLLCQWPQNMLPALHRALREPALCWRGKRESPTVHENDPDELRLWTFKNGNYESSRKIYRGHVYNLGERRLS